MIRLPPSEGARVFWLVEVDMGGERRRYADEAITIEDEFGRPIPFVAGLAEDITVTLGAVPYTAEAVAAEVQVQIVPDVDVAALAAKGHRIHGARAEVSRWVEGTTYESRRVVLVGKVIEPVYGGAGEPMDFSVSDPLYEDRAYTSGVGARVDGYTWTEAATLAPANLGVQYPIPIGKPGRSTDLHSRGWFPAVRAAWAMHGAGVASGDTDEPKNLRDLVLVVAGAHVQAKRVQAYVVSSPEDVIRLPVVNGYDERGQPIAYVPWFTVRDSVYWYDAGAWPDPFVYDIGAVYNYSLTEGGALTYGLGLNAIPAPYQSDDQELVYVAFYDDVDGDTASGALMVNGKAIRAVPDVLAYLFGLTSIQVDHGRIQAESAPLAAYMIDTVIEERTRVWDWIVGHMLPILPVAVLTGPKGLYLRVWSPAAPEVATIDLDDPEIDGSGRIEVRGMDTDNQIVVRYGRDASTGDTLGVVTVGARVDMAPNTSKAAYQIHAGCDAARNAGAALAVREVDALTVTDTATAWRIAIGLADEVTRAPRVVQAQIPEARFRGVDLWSVVRVKSARLSLDDRARVDELRFDGSGMMRVDLVILSGGA